MTSSARDVLDDVARFDDLIERFMAARARRREGARGMERKRRD